MKIFFDFDGTLVDSSEGIHIAFTRACEDVGIKAPDQSDFRSHIGPPIQQLALQFFPDIEPDRLEIFCMKFRREYDNKYYKYVQWHEGVIHGLKLLYASGSASLSIITNKPTVPTSALIASAGIMDLFETVIGIDYRVVNGVGSAFGCKRDAICYALSLSESPVDRSVYVGDTPSDQAACLDSGIHFIAATYGFHLWLPEQLQGLTSARSFGEVLSSLGLWLSLERSLTH
jgi:phosphoglycolate phosphatase